MDRVGDTWAPPSGSPVGGSGWHLGSDETWQLVDHPPAPGFWLASDALWYPPEAATEPWRWSAWGFGEVWVGFAAYIAAGLVAVAIIAVVTGSAESADEIAPGALAVYVAANAIAMVGTASIATARKGLRSLRADFGLRGRWLDPLVGLGTGLAAVLVAGLVGAGIDRALGADEPTSNIPVDAPSNATEFWVFFTAIAIVTPVVEELFFRGLVYRSFLKRGRGVWRAIVSTTIIFVAPHLPVAESWNEAVSLLGSIGVLGLAFALACHWTANRLAAPIVAHMVVNGLAAIALYVG
ncbi:MAG: type II CAAX endopeptidase family protein [Ilumatobacteraceae bacterium]